MTIDQQFWSYFTNDVSSQRPNSGLNAWSYDGTGFQRHGCVEYLKNESFVCSIVDSREYDYKDVCESYHSEKLPFNSLVLIYRKDAPAATIDIFRNYWGLKLVAQINNRDVPFTMVHMAISLDGKIATLNGDSKWIGNEQNLDHAHRLRALLDGILVGAGTVQKDNPTLNVRRVSGKSPTRFVLSNKCENFEGLQKVESVKTFLVRHEKYDKANLPSAFDDVILYTGEDKKSQVGSILSKIKSKGVNSLLIEGGPSTVSTFIEAEAIDVLQLHHTPLVLGSGKNMINLPTIKTISEGKYLKHSFYTQMGNAFMSTGSLC